MASVRFTKALQKEYSNLFQTLEISSAKYTVIDAIVKKLENNKAIYQSVAEPLALPWYLVAVIHNMEASLNFNTHLHNGDPLTARTRHVPKNRPSTGAPPFEWHESAQDALKLRKLHDVDDWSLARLLYELEGYNGWGYRLYHSHVKTPYLWSACNHCTSGKYVADGTWSDNAKSKQIGAAVLIKRMEQRALIDITSTRQSDKPVLKFAKRPVARGEDLQRFLNTFDGISLRVDGWTGSKTSEATKTVFGFKLHGDPTD